jgi:enterochelin esterase-like enzyme
MPLRTLLLIAVLFSPALPAMLLGQAPIPYHSTDINPDRSVTFRYQAPGATSVALSIDTSPAPIPMKKDATGMWQVTTPPLPPQIYGYSFEINGRAHFDPNNYLNIVPNFAFVGDQLEVPGDSPQMWDMQNVPHGELHEHYYTTAVVQGLQANQDEYIVYTPPGYDARARTRYPVLYLLHGWGGAVRSWADGMQANNILDNLLAQHKIQPMVVVMPLGYGDMRFVGDAMYVVWRDHALVDRNTSLFSQALLTEILPRVESEYNVSARREDRAIAGLSMGGLESLTIGLNHTAQFAYIGGFSAAVHLLDPAKELPMIASAHAAKAVNLRLLWIACGVDDSLLAPNRKLIAHLKGEGFAVTAVETPGAHHFNVWRDNLVQFAPLLFRRTQ